MVECCVKQYKTRVTNKFKNNLKKIRKQHKDLTKLKKVIDDLIIGLELDPKYKNHKLENDKYYKDCYECHIEPDWLLIYKYEDDELVLVLVGECSHSELF